MYNATAGVAVGGDFTSDENSLEANMATTADAGLTWTLQPESQNPGEGSIPHFHAYKTPQHFSNSMWKMFILVCSTHI
jgi:hypothetical protein